MKGHDDQQMPGAEHASSSDPFEGEGFGANGILEPKPWTNRLGAAALLLAALIALASLGSLGPAEAWARHTYEVIDRARATLAMIVDVETGVRGYALTGDSTYLKPYLRAHPMVRNQVRILDSLTIANPSQQQRIAIFATVIDRRLSAARILLAARRDEGIDAAIETVRSVGGNEATERSRELVAEIIAEEQRWLFTRLDRVRRLTVGAWASTAALVAIAIAILMRARREARQVAVMRTLALRRIKTLNAELEERNAGLVAAGAREASVNRLHSAVLANAGNAIIVTTPELAIHVFNPAAERLLGFEAAEVLGEVIPWCDPAALSALRESPAEQGEIADSPRQLSGAIAPQGEQEVTLQHRDGFGIPALVSRSSLEIEPGIPGFLFVATDIRERKAAEAGLRAKNADLRAFSVSVSHDLKAPLRGIAGYARELERRHQDGLGERARFCVAQIVGAARNLDLLIEDLLAFARVDTESPVRTQVRLADLVNRVVGDRELDIEQRGVALVLSVGELTLCTWARGLEQAISNLVDNALKYSAHSTPPRVEIGASADAAGVHITITDNGIGLKMEYSERIFGLFNRLVRADEFAGTGAGLAIVRRIMDRMGGSVRVESVLGHGACFTLDLPLASLEGAVA